MARNVRWVGQNEHGKILEQCDGLLTDQVGTFLAITVADCLPIYISQPNRGVVGLIHAGWRGLAQGVIKKTVEKLRLIPADTKVVIGPAIHQHHYPVDRSVAKKFRDHRDAFVNRGGKIFLDLIAVARSQWISFGVRAELIRSNADCTACQPDRYFSYRRDHPATLETMLAVTGRTAG